MRGLELGEFQNVKDLSFRVSHCQYAWILLYGFTVRLNIWDSGSFKADKILGVLLVLESQSLRTYGTLAALSKGHFGPIEAIAD